ncbi:MAG: hypothetical protein L3J42_00100 [Hydrogenimonas sp.]|nr:hypothetical protein [Hydrogenimonas sp.]
MSKPKRWIAVTASVLLVGTIGHAEMAVDFLTVDASPDSPANYGWGYDSRKKQSKGVCVQFSSTDTYAGGASKQESHYELAESTSDIVKKSSLSGSASLEAVAGTAKISTNNKTGVVANTEASNYNLTLFASAYRYDEPIFRYLESAQLKDDMRALLEDPKKRGEFKQRCGDGFVIGIQKGRDFLGTATVKKQTLKQSTEFTSKTGVGVKSTGYSAKADVDIAKTLISTFGSSNFEVHTYSTGSDDPNPSSVKEFKSYYRNFFKNSKDYKRTVKYIVLPYTVLADYPYHDVLKGDTKDDYIGYMADALWDLKAAIKDANFVLSPDTQKLFALGTKRNIKRKRVNAIKKYKRAWKKEFNDLLKAAQKCDKNFTSKCEQLASYYRDDRRLSDLTYKVLPDRYIDDCYSPVTLNLNDPSSRFYAKLAQAAGNSFDVVAGDSETGGNHVRVASVLKLKTDKRKLKATLGIVKIEWKGKSYYGKPLVVSNKKYNKGDSAYAKKISDYIIDLDNKNPKNPSIDRSLKTCEWRNPNDPIKMKPFRGLGGLSGLRVYGFDGGYVYGKIDAISKKDARGQIEFGPGKGLLTSIRCEVDAKGRHDNRLGCEEVTFRSFQLDLVSSQDRAANRWRDPNQYQEPAVLVNFLRNKPIQYRPKRKQVQPKYKIPASQLKFLKIKNIKPKVSPMMQIKPLGN